MIVPLKEVEWSTDYPSDITGNFGDDFFIYKHKHNHLVKGKKNPKIYKVLKFEYFTIS